jgi:isopentenyl diphosphate isomerase/L-lactate dehydrogenase-like FMN-dependent dehydrogenase
MQTTAHRREFLRFLAASPVWSALGQQETPIISSPAEALNVLDFEAAARRTIPPAHFGYLATGVDDDRTLHANREAFTRFHLRPRRLIDVSAVDTSVTLFGIRWPTPIFLCPCGSQRAFHPDGELAAARASNTQHTLQLLSTVATASLREVTQAAGRPIWAQLYPTSRWSVTETLVKRAEEAGCPVLVVTVDLPAGRNAETQQRFRALDKRNCVTCHQNFRPFFSGRQPSFEGIDTTELNLFSPALTWDSIRRMRAMTRMKIVLKGIEVAEDGRLATEHGIDGVIVSNHGGRAEESGRGPLDCLPEVVDAVGGRLPVLLDGGVRRGTDVFKALALGARAVGIGRPYLWGLGAFGQAGVERVLNLLRVELELVMKQCGTRTVEEIRPTHLGTSRA